MVTKMKGKAVEKTEWFEGTHIGVKGKIEIAEEGKPKMWGVCAMQLSLGKCNMR